jgi:hypothetical protein
VDKLEEDIRHLFFSFPFSDACWTYLGSLVGFILGISANGA